MKILIQLIILLISTSALISQNQPSIINSENGQELNSPWAGGMNSMQFGEIDIDMDGKMDLIVLNRDEVFNVISANTKGNRLYCFLNKGEEDEINYKYSPQYSKNFPELYNWAKFVDFNMDGKTDIFTYSPGWGGIKVFKNISDGDLKFELIVSPYLTSFQGGGYTNIYVTYADYPGIYDVDNDGDLDILTFSPLGSFVDLHTNLGIETYGTADSLLFERTETCWGHFAENDESNKLYLDTCTNFKTYENIADNERHTGSTLLLLDLDADEDADLLLSDIDYPGLYSLTNGGTPQDANIISYDTVFPSESETASIFSMPVAAYIDVNNDGVKDLLISTFDPSIYKSKNKNSVWLYLNKGATNNPNFQLHSKNFLQSKMLDFGSGSYPTIYDWDGDGLKDIIVGNYGYYRHSYYDQAMFLHSVFQSRIDLYKNTGTLESPKFQMWISNIGNLWAENKLALVPAISDINDDGLPDIIAGNSDGKLIFCKNTGNNEFEIQENYSEIDVEDFSTPQLFDLDNDGLLDLIIGEKKGNINYYRNEGNSQTPDFIYVTDSLGKINVTDYNLSYFGYSTPYFFRLADGTTKLLVGSEQGLIHYYENIDGNLEGKFTLSNNLDQLLDTTNVSFDRGLRTAAAMGSFEENDKMQMLIGNFAGGLEIFNADADVLPGWKENFLKKNQIKIYPNPASQIINVESLNNKNISEIKIFSSKGNLIKKFNYSSENALNKISLKTPTENGFYYLEINCEKNIVWKKIVVIN
jgi:hypothetical protein